MTLINSDKFKFDSERSIYRDENNLYYKSKNTNIKKIIIKNIDGSTVRIYKNYKKIVIIEDGSDPPDNIFIVPIDGLINNLDDVSIDMNHRDDRIKYHVISVSEWNNNIYSDKNNIYMATDEELIKINIKTQKITYIR